MNNKPLFKIPLINIWYVILSLIFITMRFGNIIDWQPIWLLSPLWIPFALCFTLIILYYILLGLVYLIDWIIKYLKKLYYIIKTKFFKKNK